MYTNFYELNELPFEQVAPEISRTLLLRKRAAIYDSLVTALTERSRIEIIDPDMKFAMERAESLRNVYDADARAARQFTKALPEPGEGSTRAANAARPASTDTTAAPPVQAPAANEEADTNGTD